MIRRQMTGAALLVLCAGCRSGTEPEPVAVSGKAPHVLTAPTVQVGTPSALALWKDGVQNSATGVNAMGDIVGISWGKDPYPIPVIWRAGGPEALTDKLGEALALNDAGQAVGVSLCDGSCWDAVMWSEGNERAIFPAADAIPSVATDIDNNGIVVGIWGIGRSKEYPAFAWRWAGKDVERLADFLAPHVYQVHNAASGEIVASLWPGDDKPGSVQTLLLGVDGSVQDIGSLGKGQTWAYDINSAGQIVGTSVAAGGELHAFVWEAGRMTELVGLGGSFSIAYGINEKGYIVGMSTTAGDNARHPVIWVEGTTVDLGVLQDNEISVATGINENGLVVGTSYSRCTPVPIVYPPYPREPDPTCFGLATATSWSVTVVPPTPAELTSRLEEAVAGLDDAGVATPQVVGALSATLDAATTKLNAGKRTAAAGILGAFINQLEAFVRSGRLSAEAAAELIEAAQLARAELNA